MKTVTMKWTGIRPYIMLNPRTVKVTDPYAKKSRELSSKMKKARKKEEEGLMAEIETTQIRNDWEASSYWDEDRKLFYMPETQILNALKGGMGRRGKDIDRGVVVGDAEIADSGESCVYIQTTKFACLEDAFKNKGFRIEGPCRIPPKTGALIWKARCQMATGWSITFTLEFDEEMIAEQSLIDAAVIAGRIVGVGAWRPKFGRFLVKVIKDGQEIDPLPIKTVEPVKRSTRRVTPGNSQPQETLTA